MPKTASTKPYLIRAIYEWCVTEQFTPHLLVKIDQNTLAPRAFIKDGKILLNLSPESIKDLLITNEAIAFTARFNGTPKNLYVPISAVEGIYAKENGEGLFFEVKEEQETAQEKTKKSAARPKLTLVKS
ncbi:MAG: ClpXP protease specificity-enhancing factor [Candidatus Methylopumilus sp.]|nr:ClpXP protease specificity-enhancing factor [Candidatus Methylopumilus sp.]